MKYIKIYVIEYYDNKTKKIDKIMLPRLEINYNHIRPFIIINVDNDTELDSFVKRYSPILRKLIESIYLDYPIQKEITHIRYLATYDMYDKDGFNRRITEGVHVKDYGEEQKVY